MILQFPKIFVAKLITLVHLFSGLSMKKNIILDVVSEINHYSAKKEKSRMNCERPSFITTRHFAILQLLLNSNQSTAKSVACKRPHHDYL